jgi:hypothetical protein
MLVNHLIWVDSEKIMVVTRHFNGYCHFTLAGVSHKGILLELSTQTNIQVPISQLQRGRFRILVVFTPEFC